MTERGEGVSLAGPRVRDVVRDVVADVVPDEVPVVEGLARFDDDTVLRRLRRRSRPDEPLGFGLGEVASLAAPVLWIVVDEAARRATGSAVDRGSRGVRVLWRLVRRRPRPPVTVPPLTREQIAEVRSRVVELGVRNGLAGSTAVALADALAVRLVLAEPEGTAGNAVEG